MRFTIPRCRTNVYVTLSILFTFCIFYLNLDNEDSFYLKYLQSVSSNSINSIERSTISPNRIPKSLPAAILKLKATNKCILNGTQPWVAMDDYNVLLYSAFYDTRIEGQTNIRLVLYKNFGMKHQAECQVTYQNGSQSVSLGQFDSINAVSPFCPGGCAWRYESFFLVCPIQTVTAGNPVQSVAVRVARGTNAPNQSSEIGPNIPVCESAASGPKRTINLTICVPALFNFDDWYRLVLFIEYYRQLGAGQFVFYKYQVSEDVHRVLQFYEHRGLAQALPWPRIPHSDPEPSFVKAFEGVSNHGQIVNSNDCILRMSSQSELVAMIDIDEYIASDSSQVGVDWLTQSLLDNMPVQSRIGGLQYRSAMAFAKWPPKRALDGVQLSDLNIDVLNETFSIGGVNPPGSRSKMVFRPERVLKQSVHQPWAYVAGFNEKVMPTNQGLIFHMRKNHNSAGSLPVEKNPFKDISGILLKAVKNVVDEIHDDTRKFGSFNDII